MALKRLFAAIDCSRNSVPTVETIRRFCDLMKKMGYTALEIYTEDTFEVEDEPFFGYLRGRYSTAELTEIVDYIEANGMEAIPSVQGLAHLEHIFRWKEYAPIHDSRDVLMVDEERTYTLLDRMFRTLRNVFKNSRYLKLGCDEASGLGRGRHLDRYGFENQTELFARHLARCVELAEKYGFKPVLSHDMFFTLAKKKTDPFPADCYTCDRELITPDVAAMFPKGAAIDYWDYFSNGKQMEAMTEGCRRMTDDIWYLCSGMGWSGYAPHTDSAMYWLPKMLPHCAKLGFESVGCMTFGDDGGENSIFASLPAYFYCAQVVKYGVTDMDAIKRNFFDLIGVEWDDFMKLNHTADYQDTGYRFNSEKVGLFSDPFTGIYDDLVPDDISEFETRFFRYADELEALADAPGYGYLFESAAALCRVMALKFPLGKRTYTAYQNGDRETLRELLGVYDRLSVLIGDFYDKYHTVWYRERKGNGFEVQDVRLGGLMCRVRNCRGLLADHLEGRRPRLEELEEKRLRFNTEDNLKDNQYGRAVTVNSLTHYNFYGI